MKTIKQIFLLMLCVLLTTHALSFEKKQVRAERIGNAGMNNQAISKEGVAAVLGHPDVAPTANP